jgi:hypothetical protein
MADSGRKKEIKKSHPLCSICGKSPDVEGMPPPLKTEFTDPVTKIVARRLWICFPCCIYIYGKVKAKVDSGQIVFEQEPPKIQTPGGPAETIIPGGKILKPS